MRRTGLLKCLQASRALQAAWSIFFVLNTILLMLAGGTYGYFLQNDFYKDNGAEKKEQITQNLLIRDSDDAMMYFFLFQNLYLEQDDLAGRDFLDDAVQEKMNKHLVDYVNRFSMKNTNFFFLIRENGEDVFKNYYDPQSSLNFYVNTKDFLNRLTNRYLVDDAYAKDTLTFEAHVRKDLEVHDDYWRVERFFHYTGILRYVVVALLPISAALEGLFAYYLFRFSGSRIDGEKRAVRLIDRVPLYILAFVFIPISVQAFELMEKKGFRVLAGRLDSLANWFDTHGESAAFFPTWDDIRFEMYSAVIVAVLTALVLAVLLLAFLSTAGVRMKAPTWWHYSLVYKVLRMRNFEGMQIFLTLLTALEVILTMWIINRNSSPFRLLLCDMAITVVLLLLIYFVGKDVAVWLNGTHRIVRKGSGYIPTENLTGETKQYAENINFLSRSANAEMEKRYINESFSTKLINGITDGLRVPLSAVAQNVEKLESGTLTEQEQTHCIDEINALSCDIKKTIEDMIRISKATTGNLEGDPVPTQVGMMLDMIGGEYGGLFAEKDMELVTEHPPQEASFYADGQFMWYIFDGILNLFLQKAVPGTRVFLHAKYVHGQAVLSFRGCLRPKSMEGTDAFASDGGMGLPTAKVFTELQGGTFRYTCRQDILQIILRFPLADDSGG